MTTVKQSTILFVLIAILCTALFSSTLLAQDGDVSPAANPTVTIEFEGTGSGTVTDDLGSINASYDGTTTTGTTIHNGTSASYTITLTAAAEEGNRFDGWYLSGARISTDPAFSFVVSSDITFSAKFETIRSLAVAGSGNGSGTITATDNLIDAAYNGTETTGTKATGELGSDTVVDVTATPSPGSTFTGWSGASSSTSPTISITIDKTLALTANFTTGETNNIISGTVTQGGSPLAGVTLNLDGSIGGGGRGGTPVNETDISAADGTFSFTVMDNFSGNLTINAGGSTTTPTQYSYTALTEHAPAQDFEVLTTTFYTISGTVTDGSGNPQSDFDVELDGSTDYATRTDASGFFSFSVPENYTGTLSVRGGGLEFTPASYSITNISSDQTGRDFTGTLQTFEISGQVSLRPSVNASDTPFQGATVTATATYPPFNSDVITATTDISGNYSLDVPAGSSVVLTAFINKDIDWSPETITIENILANTASQDFVGTGGTRILSGTVLLDNNDPAPDIRITIQGNTNMAGFFELVTTDSNGDWLYHAPETAVVATINADDPDDDAETFVPPNHVLIDFSADRTDLDFVMTPSVEPDPEMYTLSGTVTDGSNPLSGVEVQLSSGEIVPDETFTTGADGTYSFTVEEGSNYTITPVKVGYDVFTPANYDLMDIQADDNTLDFTGTLNTYQLSGTVTDMNDDPLQNAEITLTPDSGSPTTVTTPADGTYSFTVDHGFSGTITIAPLGAYDWTPESHTITSASADSPNLDFQGTLPDFTLSGTILDTDGQAVAGADVLVEPDGNSQIVGQPKGSSVYYGTNSDGEYMIPVYHGFNGTLTPSRAGATFDPTERTLTNITADTPNLDFEADITLYRVSGTISNNGVPVAGVQVDITLTVNFGPADTVRDADYMNQTVYTDASGEYFFFARATDDAAITPSRPYWTVTPATINLTSISSDVTGQDFEMELPLYNISGYVKQNGEPLSGITLEFADYTSTTNDKGFYVFTVPNGTEGVVVPTTGGYSFSPASHEILVDGSNSTRRNFDASTTAAGVPQIHYFVSSPDGLGANGKAELSWYVTGVDTVSISGLGNRPPTGSQKVNVDSSSTFILTATNANGSATASVMVSGGNLPEILLFSSSRGPLLPLHFGEELTIDYIVKGADTVRIRQAFDGKVRQGKVNPVSGELTFKPGSDTTYTLIARNNTGEVEQSIEVPVDMRPAITEFTADPDHVLPGGEVTLSWQTRRSDETSISGDLGMVDDSGSEIDTPIEDTIYTLFARNEAGTSNRDVQVAVTPQDEAIDLQVEIDEEVNAAIVFPAGDFTTLAVRISNAGAEAARDAWLNIYTDEILLETILIKNLPAGTARNYTVSVPLLNSGENTFTAAITPDYQLDIDMDNNLAEAVIEAQAVSGRDLMVGSIVVRSTGVEGLYSFEVLAHNAGDTRSRPSQLEIKISEKVNLGGDNLRLQDVQLDPLKPGESQLISGYFQWQGNKLFVRALIDEFGVHDGSNAANDLMQKRFNLNRIPPAE